MEKIVKQKNWWLNFSLAKIDLLIFSDFFLIFENPVYREIFGSYSRIISIDYPETFRVYIRMKQIWSSFLNF